MFLMKSKCFNWAELLFFIFEVVIQRINRFVFLQNRFYSIFHNGFLSPLCSVSFVFLFSDFTNI